MKLSISITVFNEEESIGVLIDSLFNQTIKFEELIIIDGKSTDNTVEIIRHYQKKDKRIKLLVGNYTTSEARNIAVELSKNEIIVMTDAGCRADPHWLERITSPFIHDEIDVVAGFYKMTTKNDFQKAESVYLGIHPTKFNIGFLPSTRSMAFRKSIWEKVGGFPEGERVIAEDTVFSHKLIKEKAKIARVKNAIVEWGMPSNMAEFFHKIFKYAVADANANIWIHEGKGIMSHNIKIISIYLRYLVGLIIFVGVITRQVSPIWLLAGIIVYLFWAFQKSNLLFSNWRVGLWGSVLQMVSDFAVMSGFIKGLTKK